MFKITKILLPAIVASFALALPLSGCNGDPSSVTTNTAVVTPTSSTVLNTVSVSNSSEERALTDSGPINSSTTIQLTMPTAQEIAIKSITSTEKMKSLKFDMDFSMSLDFPGKEQSGTMTIQQTSTASVNIPNKEMGMTMDMTMEIPNQGRQNMSAEIYTINGWMFMKADVSGSDDQWTKMKLTDEVWNQQSRLSSMTDFLKSPINLELVGSENVKGVECYVIDINPDMKSLSSWMAGQTQSGQPSVDPKSLGTSEIFQGFTVKEWIAKDSFLLARQQIGIKLNSTSAESGINSSTDMDMQAVLTYYDYGKPVSVQLPIEALSAKELVPAQ